MWTDPCEQRVRYSTLSTMFNLSCPTFIERPASRQLHRDLAEASHWIHVRLIGIILLQVNLS